MSNTPLLFPVRESVLIDNKHKYVYNTVSFQTSFGGFYAMFMYFIEFVVVLGAILAYIICTKKPKSGYYGIPKGYLSIVPELDYGLGRIPPTKQHVIPKEHSCVQNAMTALRQGREQVGIRFRARCTDTSRLGVNVTTRLAAMESDAEWNAVLHSALCTFNKNVVDSAMYHLGYKRSLTM